MPEEAPLPVSWLKEDGQTFLYLKWKTNLTVCKYYQLQIIMTDEWKLKRCHQCVCQCFNIKKRRHLSVNLILVFLSSDKMLKSRLGFYSLSFDLPYCLASLHLSLFGSLSFLISFHLSWFSFFLVSFSLTLFVLYLFFIFFVLSCFVFLSLCPFFFSIFLQSLYWNSFSSFVFLSIFHVDV